MSDQAKNALFITPNAYGKLHDQVLSIIKEAAKVNPEKFVISIRPEREFQDYRLLANKLAQRLKEKSPNDSLLTDYEKLSGIKL